VRLALRALTPVGDRPGDEDLAVREVANLGSRRRHVDCPLGPPYLSFLCPVLSDPFGGSFPGFRIAQPRETGDVAYLQGDGAFGDT